MTGLYIPEMLTPLYYTPLYSELTEEDLWLVVLVGGDWGEQECDEVDLSLT